jgi:hypothetical protein
MALVSPGVQVNVIDESFYTPAEPGTTPIIFVATAENKLNGPGDGIAPGTLKSNAERVFLLSSQRDLVETFGDPVFQTDANNNPIHGGEQNEYGLQAAYSFLGVSNRAFVVRADIDLNELSASASAPVGEPADGTWWLDTQATTWGIFQWDGASITTESGQTFQNQDPIVITDVSQVTGTSTAPGAPKAAVGSIGEYAVVAITTKITVWYKNAENTWVEVGSPEWKASWPSVVGSNSNPTTGTGDTFTINGNTITTTGTTLEDLVEDINDAGITGVSAGVVDSRLAIYNNGADWDSIMLADGTGTPLAAVGIESGEYYAPKLQISEHTDVPEYKTQDTDPRPTGSVWVKTTEPNLGANWSVKEFNAETGLFESYDTPLYETNHQALFALDRSGGGVNITPGSVYANYNVAEDNPELATFKIFVRSSAGATTIASNKITDNITAGTESFSIQESLVGSAALSDPATTISVTTTGDATDADAIAAAINSANLVNVSASVDSQNRVVITHKTGGEIRLVDTGGLLTEAGFDPDTTTNLYYTPGTDSGTDPAELVASLWKPLEYVASDDAPSSIPETDTLWYSSVIDEVDMLVHDGTTWVGLLDGNSPYYDPDPTLAPDPAGPFVQATEPTGSDRSVGTSLVTGDIWISTADIESYPVVYRYNAILGKFIQIDSTDQTTEDGILYADARYNTSGETSGEAGSIPDLLTSDYLDPDAPDPALYPRGMLLWNLRRSGFNVKRFERNYIDLNADNIRNNDEAMSAYYPHRWVTESANDADGKGSFGRKAQRKVVVQKMQSLVNSNDDIRDTESRVFNLISCPGYPELIGEMINLNNDRGLTGFIVGDTPFRLTPDATTLNEWGTNTNRAVEDSIDGLVSSDEYLGVYYPSGFTSDNAGNNVVVPPSHMALRTLALNDQVAFPWFAPAGTRRGGVTNATATGYLNNEGEFVSIALNEGQRDTLYQNNVNPITFLTGAGLVIFGQKTRARNASALDRINVARLVIYLRSQLNQLAKPFLFQPNDRITRDEIKQQTESLLVELVGLRALFDFLVVCDESNNTPARIDRNELYLDIAIEPVKAVEFIYIPLRIKNTGEISGQ